MRRRLTSCAGFVPVNQRHNDQWAAIAPLVDWAGLTVLDAGCGGGDMLRRCYDAGSTTVHGVDHDPAVVSQTTARLGTPASVRVFHSDLLDWLALRADLSYDVAFCMSVLPYVDAYRVLVELRRVSRQAFIECQYRGDGPGVVPGPTAMSHLLAAAGWAQAGCVGHTIVADRNTRRDIWQCQNYTS